MANWFNNTKNLSSIIGVSVGVGFIGLAILLYKKRENNKANQNRDLAENDDDGNDSFKSTLEEEWQPTESQKLSLNPFYEEDDKAGGKKGRRKTMKHNDSRKLRKKRTRRYVVKD